jgi:D-alanyl-D-alanine carboxypeptidase/D-alanyl-D-alanine-endopeptidase (penicillin-binding protein 4)
VLLPVWFGMIGPGLALGVEPGDEDVAGLRSRLDALLTSHGQPKARLGAMVVELPSGRVLYSRNGEQPLVPASNMKLVTMSAAIDRLGADYKMRTTLAARSKDLVILGGGDPTIGDDELCADRKESITALFHQWAAKLKAAGVKQVAGDIVIDDFIFDQHFVHPNWPGDQYQRQYEAPVGGLNFGSNCINVRVAPTKPGQRAAAALVPGNTAIELANKTVTGSRDTASVNRARDSNTVVVSGTVAGQQQLGPISVRDPGAYFGSVFKTVLAAEGIPVRGSVVRQKVRTPDGRLPKDYRVIAVQETPLAAALARAGKDSHGMTAESFFKLLGAATGEAGSWKSGKAAVDAFLRTAGVSAQEASIDDGSGLSRGNRLSAEAMTQILQYMFTDAEKFLVLRNSLSRAGIDGTLKKRMRDPSTRGRVFAKTGYINGVRTLAGYIHTSSDHWLAFAIYYNNASSTRPMTQIQDRACELLVNWPDIPPPRAGR